MSNSTMYRPPYSGSQQDWLFRVAKGQVPGHKTFGAFGERDNVAIVATGADVWRGVLPKLPHPASGGVQMTVTSSDDDDTLIGPGVEKVQINYLDGSGQEQEEIVNMNGSTGRNTIATDITWVNSMHSVQGADAVALGNITIHAVGVPVTVYNMIEAGGNMSLTCAVKVPTGKTLYIVQWYATQAGNKPTTLRLRSTDRDGTLYPDIFLFKESFYLDQAPLSDWIAPQLLIPADSIVKVSAWAAGAGGNVSAGFRGILVDDE
ncbi:MAG: hypothetical protein KAJ73_00350 [Zetaproteobacteria bacterium]|nr:hypothetical protein [Zetaproteobacteria bacterium]